MNSYMNNFQSEKSMDGNTLEKAMNGNTSEGCGWERTREGRGWERLYQRRPCMDAWMGTHQRRPWMGTTLPEKAMHGCMDGNTPEILKALDGNNNIYGLERF